MDYKEKYLKYKEKYLKLKNEQVGGSSIMTFDKAMDIYRNMLNLTNSLESVYANFWKNLYHNDAFVFYKNAIEYYKNIQNNKFHDFFSGMINKKLYTGSCQFIEKNKRKDFTNNESINNIDLDDLCNLSVQVINNLDSVFFNCPTIPFNINTYRSEYRETNDEFFKLKKGDYYKGLGYMSTSVNPWYLFNKLGDYSLKSNERFLIMNILLPKNSFGYYMNHPFGTYYDETLKKHVGLQESEILLPRGNIYEIIETKLINNCFFVTLLLKQQIIPKHNIVYNEQMDIPQKFFSKKEYEKLDKSNYVEVKGNKKDFNVVNHKIDIYLEYQKINKNRKPIDYEKFLFDKIFQIKNEDIMEMIKSKPKYSAKKYVDIKATEYDEVYDKFINLVNNKMKKINVSYINIPIFYKFNSNELRKQFMDLYKGKIIKINKPIILDKTLSSSVLSEATNFITKSLNDKNLLNTYEIDKSYPYLIIVKLNKQVKYLPLNSETMFVFDIKQIKITNIEKKQLTNDTFYYILEAI